VASPPAAASSATAAPPVEVRIDNRGDFRHGVVVLGLTGYAGWFALKSHWLTPPSFRGGFTVRVRQLVSGGGVRLGGDPSGGVLFSAPAGPTPNEAGGWRDFVGGWTWARCAGCYEWEITGHRFRESVVVRAKAP
jgi:hypothetical protein